MFVKKLASLLISLVLVLFSGGTTPPEQEPLVEYPFVMVHGMGGWGDTSSINNYVSYWGATTGSLVDFLNNEGFDCYAASVGPFSSAWDRACELYAQLTGTTVDYGVAHSQKYGHERFGRTYEEPLFEGWGEIDENGNLKKVNLYGHSFGGATVRLLAHLLEYGCDEEIATTPEGEISPLFVGGKGDWVFSITTLASPHNGTTLLYALEENTVENLLTVFYAGVSMIGSSEINDYIDMQLDRYGLTGESGTSELTYDRLIALSKTEDNVFYDLTLDGASELNNKTSTVDSIYYYSFAVQGTIRNENTGYHVPTSDIMAILWLPSTLMGKYSENDKTDYIINEEWLPNDGLVNTISAYAPFEDNSIDYTDGASIKGVWQKMPLTTGDHGSVIGLMAQSDETHTFFMNHMEMINNLK